MLRRRVIVKEQVVILVRWLLRLWTKCSCENWRICSRTIRISLNSIRITLDSSVSWRLLGHAVQQGLDGVDLACQRSIGKEIKIASCSSRCCLRILLAKMMTSRI